MRIKGRFMDTNEFDDSLDGSLTKSKTISQEELIKAIKIKTQLKEHQDKQLNELIDNSPELGSETIRGTENEELAMKVLQRKGETSATWLVNNMHMKLRTAGYTLVRLRERGIVTSEYKRIKGVDGHMRITNVFSLVKKDAIKGRKGKRNSKKV